MKNRSFYILIIVFTIFASPVQAKSISESFPIHASSPAIGYLSLHGVYDSISWNSNSSTAKGFGFGFGLKVIYPVYLEAYLDYLNHSGPLSADTAINSYKNSVHVGGRTVFLLGRYFTLKAGVGLANIVSQLNSAEVTTNKPEINLCAGVNLPLNSVFSFDINLVYRKILDSVPMRTIGGTAGLVVKFY
jgi:hypothetical protein